MADDDPDPGTTNTGLQGFDGDVGSLFERLGFDPETSVLTRRQAEVYVLREHGLHQSEIADRLGTSRANVASIEGSARENVRKARNTIDFADVLSAPIRVDIAADTDLNDVPREVFAVCDDRGVQVDHTAPELMEKVSDAAGDAVQDRTVTRPISIGINANGVVSVSY